MQIGYHESDFGFYFFNNSICVCAYSRRCCGRAELACHRTRRFQPKHLCYRAIGYPSIFTQHLHGHWSQ